MNGIRLTLRSLKYYWRWQIGLALGVAVAAAVIAGSLVTGDSVRATLAKQAEVRLGKVGTAVAAADGFFTESLAGKVPGAVPVLLVQGTVSVPGDERRANNVNIFGVRDDFWTLGSGPGAAAGAGAAATTGAGAGTADKVVMNAALASMLGFGAEPGPAAGGTGAGGGGTADREVIVRFEKPSLISRDAPLSGETDLTVSLRRSVGRVAADADMGAFSLKAQQEPALNLYLPLAQLQEAADLPGRANLLLSPEPRAEAVAQGVGAGMTLDDAGLGWREAGAQRILSTGRIFLSPEAEETARAAYPDAKGVLTYLVNQISKSSPEIAATNPADGTATTAAPNVNSAAEANGAAKPEAAAEVPAEATTEVPGQTPAEVPAQTAAEVPAEAAPESGGAAITPYSMATATAPGTGGLPTDWPDGAVVITQWLADDLALKIGDKLSVKYFRVTRARQLEEAESEFTVHAVLPMDHPAVRREWTPDFPGVTESENCRDWKPGIPIDQSLIRDKDDAYWKERKGTPKIFLTLNDGQKMWSNRFGKLTSLWLESPAPVEELTSSLQKKLTPAQAGLVTVGVKEAAGKAVSGSMDFGALFVSMSAFLIGTALLLAVLLFMFGTGQRAGQIGLLLASGWTPAQVRRLFVREAMWVTVPAAAVGTALGLFYTRWTLGKLEQDWGDAALGLRFSLTIRPVTLGIAWVSTVVLGLLAVWWAARRVGRARASRLLAGASLAEALGNPASAVGARRWRMLPKGLMTLGGLVMLYMSSKVPPHVSPLMFFGAGALLLADGLRGLNWWLGRQAERTDEEKIPGLWDLGVRNALRQRGRSMAMAALLAAGIFMVVALNAFRQDARLMPSDRESGTGGFALVGTSTLPVYEDLDSAAGRAAWGLEDEETKAVFVVPFRAREGEEASCLNLNRAQLPRVLGVDPVKLAEREAFPIAGIAKGVPLAEGVSPWMLLNQKPTDGTVPAIMDQVSAMYALGKSVGDEITVPDGQGNPVRLRLVALLAGTVLQGNVIIGDAAFVRLYPDTGGFKYFLVDAAPEQAPVWRAAAVRQLANRGLAMQPVAEKLAQFQAVQNTYLTIFSTLGGLALVLSTLGLGVLVARHVLERKSEFALLQAVGFHRSQLQKMVLAEHWFLLLSAIVLGTLAALIAVWPNLRLAGAGGIPLRLLAGLLISLTAGGLIFCHLAARLALSRRLTDSLRHE